MILPEAFLLAVLFASLFLFLALFCSRLTARLLQVNQELPPELVKVKGSSLLELLEVILQAELWEVFFPFFLYSLIAPHMPSSGIKSGLIFGLLVFLIGSLPQLISLSENLKLPLAFLLHQLVWKLVKIFLIFGTFGYFLN